MHFGRAICVNGCASPVLMWVKNWDSQDHLKCLLPQKEKAQLDLLNPGGFCKAGALGEKFLQNKEM